MHLNSLEIMQKFVAEYMTDEELKILDLGSRVVSGQNKVGSYKNYYTNKKWKYVGADIEAGENVDVVLRDGYVFPFNDETFDVVISGQTIEHMEYPWVWFREVARVLKKGGKCCIIGPAVIFEHKFPIDTYRYYPDGMRALAKWSGLEVLHVEKVINKYSKRGGQDTYLVAKKP